MSEVEDDFPDLPTEDSKFPAVCHHKMDHYVDIVEDGKVVGNTIACSKCGTTQFELDTAWGGPWP